MSAVESDSLAKFTVAEVAQGKPDLVYVDAQNSVGHTLEVLASNNILSCPVVKDEFVVGVVSLWDLVTAVSFQSIFDHYDGATITPDALETATWLANWLRPEFEAYSNKIENLIGVSDEGKQLWVFRESDSLSKLSEVFHKGVHRVLVHTDEAAESDYRADRKYPNIKDLRQISQTDVLRFIVDKADQDKDIAAILDSSVKQLQLGHSFWDEPIPKPIALNHASSALTGFRLMHTAGVTGLPVVDGRGKLVGTLTASDLRGVTRNTLEHSLLTVGAFLKEVRGQVRDVEPLSALESDSLKDIVTEIIRKRVHRCWLTDENDKLEGVITLSDIIRQFTCGPAQKKGVGVEPLLAKGPYSRVSAVSKESFSKLEALPNQE